MIRKFTVSRDDSIYEAWPDVTLTPGGKLICVFSECNHHNDRSYTRIVLCESTDRGRTWSAKRPLTDGTSGFPYWNCARIQMLKDGRLAVVVDRISAKNEEGGRVYIFFSEDEGATWSAPLATAVQGIVPDRIVELAGGTWLLSAHHRDPRHGYLVQRLWFSDNEGRSWEGPVDVANKPGLNLCEVSILPVEKHLVAFMRENSGFGLPCYKCISSDNGRTWSPPVEFPLPGCHRPVAGFLNDGRILITYRFTQGGANPPVAGSKYRVPRWQNFFAAVTDASSALAPSYRQAWTRIIPIDFDRSALNDLGYSGWVQFPDGEVYIVNYIMDDSPKCQIRGYALRLEDFTLPAPAAGVNNV
ncbi:MAG TPA: exo-alpha-sialidase [Firmicutes bacterium]|nr:exo-alpha-sialidase [Bacillota bacterium]